MFKEKVSHHLSKDTKSLVNHMFLFKFITFLEIIGFSLIISLLIIPFLHSKPNILLVFLPVFVFISVLYLSLNPPKRPRG